MVRKQYQARFTPAGELTNLQEPPFRDTYPVVLQDGSCLELPLQPFPDGQQAIALLMSNQTSFAVEQALVPLLTALAKEFAPEVIVGIPTLGLDYARLVAKTMDFPHYVALGNSRKFWYSDELSMPVVSVTSPGAKKSLYIDPALVERVSGCRTLLVDDVINTGGTAVAAIQLLEKVGANVVGLVVVLTEGHEWKTCLQQMKSGFSERVRGVGHIPMFQQVEAGWVPIPNSV